VNEFFVEIAGVRIGQVSAATGVDVETIRYYEREGLLRKPERSASRYREYQAGDIEELKFIRRCRSLDITLAEIRTLQSFRHQPDQTCGDINALVDSHLEEVRQRIEQLRELEQQLVTLRLRCSDARTAETCGILKSLESTA
jgi:Cd(II)/Pb(II)-responsive transcriptional regulator